MNWLAMCVLALFVFCESNILAAPFRVQIQEPAWGQDHLVLNGDYEPATSDNAPTLVLLHGLGSTRGEWDSFAKEVRARGWGTLTYDARGHGNSQSTTRGGLVSYQDPRFGRNPLFLGKMVDDLRQVLLWLKTQKNVAPEKMVLVGASLGSSVAVNAAQDLPVMAFVLLSPGLRYAGIEVAPAMAKIRRPILIVVSPADGQSFMSVRKLRTEAPNPKITVWLSENGGPQGVHGVQMFDGNLEERILDWIAACDSKP